MIPRRHKPQTVPIFLFSDRWPECRALDMYIAHSQQPALSVWLWQYLDRQNLNCKGQWSFGSGSWSRWSWAIQRWVFSRRGQERVQREHRAIRSVVIFHESVAAMRFQTDEQKHSKTIIKYHRTGVSFICKTVGTWNEASTPSVLTIWFLELGHWTPGLCHGQFSFKSVKEHLWEAHGNIFANQP